MRPIFFGFLLLAFLHLPALMFASDSEIASLASRQWDPDAKTFEYAQEFPQNGEQAKSQTRLEIDGQFGYYAIPRSDVGHDGMVDLVISNPEYTFHIQQRHPDGLWTLLALDLNDNINERPTWSMLQKADQRLRQLPYTLFNGMPATEFLDEYELQEEEDGNHIRVVANRTKAGSGPLAVFESGEIVINRPLGAVESFRFTGDSGAFIEGGSVFSSVDQQKQFAWKQKWFFPPMKAPFNSSTELTLASNAFERNRDEFYLSFYGLPEPGYRRNPYVLPLVAIGLVAGFIAIGLRRRVKHARTS